MDKYHFILGMLYVVAQIRLWIRGRLIRNLKTVTQAQRNVLKSGLGID